MSKGKKRCGAIFGILYTIQVCAFKAQTMRALSDSMEKACDNKLSIEHKVPLDVRADFISIGKLNEL